MNHIKHCPHIQVGNLTTLFFDKGHPQKYCMGWTDITGRTLDVCRECPEYYNGIQAKEDKEKAQHPFYATYDEEQVKCDTCANWRNGQCFRYRTRDPKRLCMCADENFTAYVRKKS